MDDGNLISISKTGTISSMSSNSKNSLSQAKNNKNFKKFLSLSKNFQINLVLISNFDMKHSESNEINMDIFIFLIFPKFEISHLKEIICKK